MFHLKRAFAMLGLAGLLTASAVGPAFADDAVISGGSLSAATVSGALAFSTTIDGTDQTLESTPVTIDIDDLRGTGAGWKVTVASTQFSTGGGLPKTLAATALKVSAATSGSNGTGTYTAPNNDISFGSPVTVGTTATTIFNAAVDSGMGKFRISPTFTLSVPANVYANTYSSTVTVASASGPS